MITGSARQASRSVQASNAQARTPFGILVTAPFDSALLCLSERASDVRVKHRTPAYLVRMPCRCSGHSATTARASQASKRHLPDLSIHRGVLISPPHAFSHQLPALSQQIAVRPRYEATGHRQTGNRTLCQAQQQEEKEKDMVGGFDVDAEPGFLESEAVGIIFKVQCQQILNAIASAS